MGGHKTRSLFSITYSLVVSQDSVRICLLITSTKNIDPQSEEIINTYLLAPYQERIWTRAGPELGKDEDKLFIIVM